MHSTFNLIMQCIGGVIFLNINVYEFKRRAIPASEKKLQGVQDFGQCTGENWSPLQGCDSNRLAAVA